MKERVDEIDAEQNGDAQADDGFVHGVSLSKSPAGARISAHQYKEKDAETDINEIGHHPLLFFLRMANMGADAIKALFEIRPSRIKTA